jgi:hypothetical protein
VKTVIGVTSRCCSSASFRLSSLAAVSHSPSRPAISRQPVGREGQVRGAGEGGDAVLVHRTGGVHLLASSWVVRGGTGAARTSDAEVLVLQVAVGEHVVGGEREKSLAEHLGATALRRRRMTCGSTVG